jgi:hypothetical protein
MSAAIACLMRPGLPIGPGARYHGFVHIEPGAATMPFITSADDARAARKPVEVQGRTYYLSPYMGSAPTRGRYEPGNEINDDGMPQGFLVEQPSGAVTPPHFHDHEQFQVVVDGGGFVGKKTAMPLSVHYAGGHTPYGPIVAGEEGIFYFTLRSRWDAGAKYMPASRDKLKPVKRKHRLAAAVQVPSGDALKSLGEGGCAEVMAPLDDGTCAYLFTVGAGKSVAMETPVNAGGQYAILVGGSAMDAGRELPRLSGFYRFRDEDPLTVTAGGEGAAILLMQFSKDDPA